MEEAPADRQLTAVAAQRQQLHFFLCGGQVHALPVEAAAARREEQRQVHAQALGQRPFDAAVDDSPAGDSGFVPLGQDAPDEFAGGAVVRMGIAGRRGQDDGRFDGVEDGVQVGQEVVAGVGGAG